VWRKSHRRFGGEVGRASVGGIAESAETRLRSRRLHHGRRWWWRWRGLHCQHRVVDDVAIAAADAAAGHTPGTRRVSGAK